MTVTSSLDLDQILPTQMIIGDSFVSAGSGGQFEHVNPTTGDPRALPLAGPDDVDRAVQTASAALVDWRKWSPVERRRVLFRFAGLIQDSAQQLGQVITLEGGVPTAQAPFMVAWPVEWIEASAGWADKLFGDTMPGGKAGNMTYSVQEPYGVIAAITPSNGSLGSFGMAVGPVLAAGCTVVIKPSELAPFGACRLTRLALEAGIPPGVINVVNGDGSTASALISHPGIAKVTFTGSPPTARKIAAACVAQLKPCLFELGGKSATIVFDDADIPNAVQVATGVFLNAGQSCTLGSRLIVHDQVYEQFAEQLAKSLTAVKVGDPLDPETMMGPVIGRVALDRILGYVERARGYGNVRTGGKRLGGDLANGFFMSPALVDEVGNDSEIATEELFGPVLTMLRFSEEEEALAIANDSEFGLAGDIFTENLARTIRVSEALDTSNIGVNGGFAPSGPHLPFGGRKQSGYGKQGGLAGVMEFVHTKTVQVKLKAGLAVSHHDHC